MRGVATKRSITGNWRKIRKIQDIAPSGRRRVLSHGRFVRRKIGRRGGGVVQVVQIIFKLFRVVDIRRMLLRNIGRNVVAEWRRSRDVGCRSSANVGILKWLLSWRIGDVGRSCET